MRRRMSSCNNNNNIVHHDQKKQKTKLAAGADWTKPEDDKLLHYIKIHGEGSDWSTIPQAAGLERCGKSCRLRWMNYLRPDHIKRRSGNFSLEEDDLIIKLHALLGNRWSLIAGRLPGRTDDEVKNYWNSNIKRKLINMGIDPNNHTVHQTQLLLTYNSHQNYNYNYNISNDHMISRIKNKQQQYSHDHDAEISSNNNIKAGSDDEKAASSSSRRRDDRLNLDLTIAFPASSTSLIVDDDDLEIKKQDNDNDKLKVDHIDNINGAQNKEEISALLLFKS